MIYILKHNNKHIVVAINSETTYKLWAKEEGIEIELSLIYTYKPNRTAKQAGQEVITKLIKIRISACLFKKLWPKYIKAAIFLYNISLLKAYYLRSPNIVLDLWFQNYFR